MLIGVNTIMLAALATATPAAHCAAQSVPVDGAAISQLMLHTLRETTAVPGMSAAVWQDGAILWQGASGHRDLAANLPATPNTLFRLASVSKLFAATAAAKLAEGGQLDLDAPVAGQLDWLRTDWSPFSPRQLAAHITGLPHYQDQDRNRGHRAYRTGRDAVAIFADRALLTTPGERYSYSSWGYTLLGAMIEEKAGMAFPGYVAQRLVPGLAIQADATDGSDTRASRAYGFSNGQIVRQQPHDFSYTWAGGGLSGTASALAEFGGRMLSGQIVVPATFAAMLAPTRFNDGSPVRERDYTVGLGWRVSEDKDGAEYAHHSGVAIGARSTLGVWRATGMAVSLLSNAEWVSRIEPTAQMLAAPFRSAPRGLTPASCPASATRYRGTLGGQVIEGVAAFRIEHGRCIGTIQQHPILTAWFGTAMQRGDAPLTIIGLDDASGLARGGLVHPFGISDLRALPTGGFSATITETQTISLSFSTGEIAPAD